MHKVPVALIRRLCYPSTYRLPKLKRLMFPRPVSAKLMPETPVIVPYSRLVGNRVLPGSSEGVVHNLPNEDYRIWFGRAHSGWCSATCRWCGAICHTKETRNAHLLNGTCDTHLLAIYRILRKDGNCACCDDRTTKAKWGVPLCSDECVDEWRISLPGVLKFEIGKALAKLEGVASA